MNAVLQRIEASEKQVSEVFSDYYSFTIPPYQRPYAWELQQATELLNDLLDAMQPDSESNGLYFLGSIVLVKAPDQPDSRVVDGQQRLTTLTILFSVLRDLTPDDELKVSRDSYIRQAANRDLDRPERLRLHLRQRDQDFFGGTIQRRGSTSCLPHLEGLEGSRANIVENAAGYRRVLSAMTDDKRDDLISFVLNRCYLVVVTVPTDAAARRIFTVLNARGLDLTATDILKADLLERAGEFKEERLSARWEEIEAGLDRDRFTDLFTHIRMIFQREKPRSALDIGFPQFVLPFLGDPERFISETLEPFADALTSSEDHEKLNRLFGVHSARLLESLRRLDNKDWVPPLLLKFKKHSETGGVDVSDFVMKLERLAYYLFVTRADINERMARYADVLDEIDPRPDRDRRSAGLELNDVEVADFFGALNGQIYLKSRVVKSLLLRLELSMSDGSASYDYPTISVEHVCPQTIADGSEWDKWFRDRQAHTQWLHCLANLVLLTHRKNSSAGNWDFERKKQVYFTRNDSCPFLLTRQVLDEQKWTPAVLQTRQKQILHSLAKSWDIEEKLEKWLATEQASMLVRVRRGPSL